MGRNLSLGLFGASVGSLELKIVASLDSQRLMDDCLILDSG